MQLSSTLSWLVDAAVETPGADRLLAEVGARLIADGMPLAGGALTMAVPHPLIARRTWLWRADSGEVIEALGFVAGGLATAGAASPPDDAGRRWLAGMAAGPVHEDAVGSRPDGPSLGWIGPRPFTPHEAHELRQIARFAAAPLAVLATRATLTRLSRLISAGAAQRGCWRVLCGATSARPSRRRCSMPICAASLPYPRAIPPAAVIAALDAWFDRSPAVHAFGGEVLKFIGDGVLAIFPVVGDTPRGACDAALRAVSAARVGMAHLGQRAAATGTAVAVVRRRPACRRDFLGQYRRRRPARFHGDRPRRQSGQPVGRAMPAARQDGPGIGRARRRDRSEADPARDACVARYRIAMRRLHRAGELSRRLVAAGAGSRGGVV